MGEKPTQLTKEEFEAWQDGKIKEVDGVKLCPPLRHMRHGLRYYVEVVDPKSEESPRTGADKLDPPPLYFED